VVRCYDFDVAKGSNPVAIGGVGRGKVGHERARVVRSGRRHAITEDSAAARNRGLPESLRNLFWSYRFEDLRLPDALDEVMLHVLTHGRPNQKAWLRWRFGDDGVRRWIIRRRGKGLTVAQMQPWVTEATARRWQAGDPNARLWENR
jgi:hypothetical protein